MICVQDRFGFSFVSGVPSTPEATERLVERIGFIRETQCKYSIRSSHFLTRLSKDGRFWDFTSDLARGDTAYTTLALGAHTDNTYYVRDIVLAEGCSNPCLSRRTLLVFNCSISSPILMVVEAPPYWSTDSTLLPS